VAAGEVLKQKAVQKIVVTHKDVEVELV